VEAPRTATIACVAALVAGCGVTETAPVSSTCSADPDVIVRALQAAPQPVTLDEGRTRLSQCIRGSRSAADLQTVGITFTNAAEDLEVRAPSDPRAALQLGYLVGATRRGTDVGAGIQDELLRRIERSAALDGATPAADRALQQGLAAGEKTG
jgi:hypothetical protein